MVSCFHSSGKCWHFYLLNAPHHCVEHSRGRILTTSATYTLYIYIYIWWRHQIETFSASLAFCARKLPVTGEFPSQRPVSRSLDIFVGLRLNKRLSKQSWGWWFETPSRSFWRHCNEGSRIGHPFTCRCPSICQFYRYRRSCKIYISHMTLLAKNGWQDLDTLHRTSNVIIYDNIFHQRLLHRLKSVGWNYYIIPKLQRFTLHWVSDYLCMQEQPFPYLLSYRRYSRQGRNSLRSPDICEINHKTIIDITWHAVKCCHDSWQHGINYPCWDQS